MGDGPAAPTRADRRRLRTRAALIEAAQRLIADGRQNVSVLEITRLADVGQGSFYNHFETKEDLYEAALHDVLDRLADVLDSLTGDLVDPVEIFAQNFRLTGRMFRLAPRLSEVLLHSGVELIHADLGLGPRARRDILAGVRQNRLQVRDVDLAVTMAAGTLIALGALLKHDPDRDDASSADAMTQDLLTAFGVPADEAEAICRLPLPALEFSPPREAASN